MNLQKLCSIIPQVNAIDEEAVVLLRASMEAVEKVHAPAKIYFGENAQKTIRDFLEKELQPFSRDHIIWHGAYRANGKIEKQGAEVEFWFFIHGLLIIRNLQQNQWMLHYRTIKKKEWMAGTKK